MERKVELKPTYKIPSLKEIKKIPLNGYKAVSTFSGCGGSSLGYKLAGFEMLWANEFIESAQEVYRLNHPTTHLNPADIRDLTPEAVLEQIGLKRFELDLFDGSPPCASFSTAGKRHHHWGKDKKYSDTVQRTDDLFFEYARLIEGIQPKVFIAENVSGLVKGTAKGYFKEIITHLKSLGYDVACKLLNAKWLGVPQSRERTIFVGVRKDLGLKPVHPKPLPYLYSINDALPNLKSRKQNYLVEEEAFRFIQTPCYANEWEKLKIGQTSQKFYQFVKVNPNKPITTITATNARSASQVHPYEKRKFAIAELKKLSSFPDDFILKGNYQEQWERIGRAVPPMMMYHVAKTVQKEILDKL